MVHNDENMNIIIIRVHFIMQIKTKKTVLKFCLFASLQSVIFVKLFSPKRACIFLRKIPNCKGIGTCNKKGPLSPGMIDTNKDITQSSRLQNIVLRKERQLLSII